MGYLTTVFIAAIKPSQIVLDDRTKPCLNGAF
jgi:hypothetical protein